MKRMQYLAVFTLTSLCGCGLSSTPAGNPTPARQGAVDPIDASVLASIVQECSLVSETYREDSGTRRLIGLKLWDAPADAIAAVSRAGAIEHLEFIGTDLRTQAFDQIGELTSLKSLKVTICKFLPTQLHALQDLDHLEELQLQFSIFEESSEKRAQMLGILSAEEIQLRDALMESGKKEHIIQVALLTDRALPALSKLTRLNKLSLENTIFTANGLQHLKPLVNLEVADLGVLELTGPRTQPLQRMTKLRSLRYFNADDQVVAALSSIGSLEDLEIWSEGVTDVGVDHLLKLNNLRRLSIRGSQITDQGLSSVVQLPELEYLDLSYATHLTAGGIAQFQQRRPSVEIRHAAD